MEEEIPIVEVLRLVEMLSTAKENKVHRIVEVGGRLSTEKEMPVVELWRVKERLRTKEEMSVVELWKVEERFSTKDEENTGCRIVESARKGREKLIAEEEMPVDEL
ncbi:Hypothetical predicted protein [Olea europaea subsp. europaea]|uniref:Uncharacterized protein n=1 Tax=Olea europaea subsp. europaea TaxID=158383 RepID=A0A8S0TJS7_OLEEU|nr:Hypothetical predicted protein [Olea europaea subsp. europaea]